MSATRALYSYNNQLSRAMFKFHRNGYYLFGHVFCSAQRLDAPKTLRHAIISECTVEPGALW